MESADCVAATGGLRSGVRLPSLGRDRHRVLFGSCGPSFQDSMYLLVYDYESATKETSAGCF